MGFFIGKVLKDKIRFLLLYVKLDQISPPPTSKDCQKHFGNLAAKVTYYMNFHSTDYSNTTYEAFKCWKKKSIDNFLSSISVGFQDHGNELIKMCPEFPFELIWTSASSAYKAAWANTSN